MLSQNLKPNWSHSESNSGTNFEPSGAPSARLLKQALYLNETMYNLREFIKLPSSVIRARVWIGGSELQLTPPFPANPGNPGNPGMLEESSQMLDLDHPYRRSGQFGWKMTSKFHGLAQSSRPAVRSSKITVDWLDRDSRKADRPISGATPRLSGSL